MDEGIVLRADQPSLSAPIYGIWPQNTRFYYDAFYIADGYVLLVEQIRQARIYLPIGPNDGNAQNTWGSFTS